MYKELYQEKAWPEFRDHLKTAGAAPAYPGAPTDVFQQVEGVRYLTTCPGVSSQSLSMKYLTGLLVCNGLMMFIGGWQFESQFLVEMR